VVSKGMEETSLTTQQKQVKGHKIHRKQGP
jgi:hypothetical protein